MTEVFHLTMQFYFLFVLLFSFVMRPWNHCCDWSGATFCAQFQFFVWGWSLAAQGQNEAIQHLRQVAAHPLPVTTIMGMRDHRQHSDCAHHSSSSAFSNNADDASSLGFLPPAALWESNNLLDWMKGVGDSFGSEVFCGMSLLKELHCWETQTRKLYFTRIVV